MKIFFSLISSLVISMLLSASCLVAQSPTAPALACGVNADIDFDYFSYVGVMINISAEKNDENAKAACKDKAKEFNENNDKKELLVDSAKCPRICDRTTRSHSESSTTTFSFEPTQHDGESKASWIRRREELIKRAIANGECGDMPEEHRECRRAIADGDFTLYKCLVSWEINWMRTCFAAAILEPAPVETLN